ncbi:MAG: hypothetical protein ACT4O1_15590 [Gemmatimonadota bacterium]
MSQCEVCGNDYARSFTVSRDGESHTFDCFECAIHSLAPDCANCGIKVVGHGVEQGTVVFCCAHCARATGVSGLKDHVDIRRATM